MPTCYKINPLAAAPFWEFSVNGYEISCLFIEIVAISKQALDGFSPTSKGLSDLTRSRPKGNGIPLSE